MVPMPLSGTLCGLLGALSVMVSAPVRVLSTVGVNVTVNVQYPFGAKGVGVIGQLFVWLKSPLIAIELISRFAVPLFVSLSAHDLLLPSNTLLNVRGVGCRVTAGCDPPPQPGKTKLPIAVCQLKLPLVWIYSSVNQKVQSSAGSTVIEL